MLGNNARATAHRAVHRVEILDAIQSIQCQYQLAITRHSTRAEAGASAGGNNRQLFARGQAHHFLHLLNRSGQYNRGGVGSVDAGPVTAVLLQGIRVSQYPLRADDMFQWQ